VVRGWTEGYDEQIRSRIELGRIRQRLADRRATSYLRRSVDAIDQGREPPVRGRRDWAGHAEFTDRPIATSSGEGTFQRGGDRGERVLVRPQGALAARVAGRSIPYDRRRDLTFARRA
jgi:hypothetical protein